VDDDSDESKTNFQLVRVVLDQLHADVAADHGKNADKVIEGKLKLLSESYTHLTEEDFPPIDYAPAETRFAYVFSYVAANADYVYQILGRTRRKLWKKFDERDKLVVTCLGGGPGSELVGLMQFVAEEDGPLDFLTAYLLDREQAWADCWTEIGPEVGGGFDLNTPFQSLDVTKPESWAKQKKFLSADLFIMSYFASEIARLGGAADAFWNDLSTKAKPGALMLIMDNDHNFFSDFITKRIISNSWKVLSTECVTITPSNREQKVDLGDYLKRFNRSPRLKGRMVYWVLEKT
jgi:hypothetical protein